jgi:uncharacterized membrane protein
MLKFFRRNKLAFDIAMVIVALLASFLWWYDFFKGDEWQWLGGVIFGIIAIIKVVDLIDDLRNRKKMSHKSPE